MQAARGLMNRTHVGEGASVLRTLQIVKVADKVRVAGKYLVSTLAGKHDFDVALAHAPAEQVFGNNMAVVGRHFRVPDGSAKMICNVVAVQTDRVDLTA